MEHTKAKKWQVPISWGICVCEKSYNHNRRLCLKCGETQNTRRASERKFPEHHLVDVSQEGAHPTSDVYWTLRRKVLKLSERWQLLTLSIWARLIATQCWSSECSLEGFQLMVWINHARMQSESCSTEFVSSLSVLWPVLIVYQHLGTLQYCAGVIFSWFQRPHEACVLCILQLMPWRQDGLLSLSCYFVLPKILHATLT